MNEKWRVLLISVLTPSGVITAVSLFVIWGYFSRLNRLDVFFEVMNIQSIFALIFCAVILSLLFLLSIFFVSSVFMAVVIPQDVNNLPGYDKMKTNFLSVLMIAGLFPTTFIYIFYYALDLSQGVKDNSAWISMFGIGLMTVVVSALINRKHLEKDLSSKRAEVKRTRRYQFYLGIPLSIALLAHLQVFPLEIVFRNISASDEKVNFWTITGLAFISYMVYFLSLFPGLVYLRMGTHDKMLKKISASFIVSLMVLLIISTKITVIPVMFTHSVIKLSGISDFTVHRYIIKSSEYPEEFFASAIWKKKIIKAEQYYAVSAVSMFTTNQFSFLCPETIVKSYRESWKFNPWDSAFDTTVRHKLQEQAADCVPVSAAAVKRWDISLH
ncbi:hypothetical protein [Lelliottia wanjuensis]|uniref:Uncharacterized protein n=1 Tax=Lelliottia wanjuensis TaxID=3050585 RepID=A0AAP4FTC5_9ENTR|nr:MULTISPECIES: hypothetical protein [unclassified Lelliottia]MDK9361895.1 hypothetical protein [Lelliottia sp. V106_12]MDK9584380.1 hypothetical protein [Lelliottia sp. V86_10]MDK9617295.1 hypothetical protein [Lelliottia sp. V106_9]